MTIIVPNPYHVVAPCGTGNSYSARGPCIYSIQRLPTDPLYYADVVIENIVVGSAYILGYTPAGGEFTSLGFSGIVPGTPGEKTTITLSNVPSYATVMLLELRVRKSSATPKYKPLVTYTNHSPNGSGFYVVQQIDRVVT